jgi:hypothetical protein
MPSGLRMPERRWMPMDYEVERLIQRIRTTGDQMQANFDRNVQLKLMTEQKRLFMQSWLDAMGVYEE